MLPYSIFKLFGSPKNPEKAELSRDSYFSEDTPICGNCEKIRCDDGSRQQIYILSHNIHVISAIRFKDEKLLGRYADIIIENGPCIVSLLINRIDKPVELPFPIIVSKMISDRLFLVIDNSIRETEDTPTINDDIELYGWMISRKTARFAENLAFQISDGRWCGIYDNHVVSYEKYLDHMKFVPGAKWAWLDSSSRII